MILWQQLKQVDVVEDGGSRQIESLFGSSSSSKCVDPNQIETKQPFPASGGGCTLSGLSEGKG